MTFCICVCIWPEKRVRHSLHRRSVPLVCSQNSDATFSTTGGWALLFCVVFKVKLLRAQSAVLGMLCCVSFHSQCASLGLLYFLAPCPVLVDVVLCCVPPTVCLCACPVLVDVGLLWPQFHLSSVMPRDCLVALTPSFFGSPLALWILEYLFIYQLFLLCRPNISISIKLRIQNVNQNQLQNLTQDSTS